MNPAEFGSAALAICFCLTLALPQTGASWLDNEYADVEVTTPDGPRTLSLRPVDDTQLAGTALAIDNEGCLFVWGYRGTGLGGEGELEVKSNQPANRVCLEGLEIEDATAAAGTFTTDGSSLYGQRESDDDRVGIAALASDGTVWTWGCFKGELCGRSLNTIGKATPGKAEIPLGEGEIVVDLKSATGIFLALTNLGNLYTWGDATAGDFAYPLGQGDAESSDRPVRILTKVHSFGSGPYAAWAVVADGWATVRDLTEPAANTRQAGIVFWGTQSVGYQTCAAANGYTTA
ncbi:MAG: hypothetical protein LBR21_10490, partial [Propionibacteriaceae bacterium]|nr:hypothetical protein [Propionibacteriaceae bacterium]